MRLRPEQLAQQLKKNLLPIYVVSGEDPLLMQECCDQIRRRAREDGCTEREIIEAATGNSNSHWQELIASAASMSLFAERKLVELRLPSGKPGAEGSKTFSQYLDMASGDDVLLIVAGKIDKQSTNSKWFKALDSAGAIIQVWPVDSKNLPRWLQNRISMSGMSIDNEALQLLCERVEGNLLAAVQEVEKLKLLADEGRISVDTITASVSNNARYNVFEMADNALKGDSRASLRMLHGLRGEGTEAISALWALEKDIRTLSSAQADCDRGQNPQQALSARRVWNNRMPQMQAALARHNSASLTHLMEQALAVDGSIKGYAAGKPWDKLESLIAGLCGSGRSGR
jgi:DNA polymerase III subunit delta